MAVHKLWIGCASGQKMIATSLLEFCIFYCISAWIPAPLQVCTCHYKFARHYEFARCFDPPEFVQTCSGDCIGTLVSNLWISDNCNSCFFESSSDFSCKGWINGVLLESMGACNGMFGPEFTLIGVGTLLRSVFKSMRVSPSESFDVRLF